MTGRAVLFGLAVGLALLPAAAEAHLLRLFAAVDGLTISGYGFFVGGGRPQAAEVIVRDGGGAELARTQTDSGGTFTWLAPAPGDYRVTIDAGDGHFTEIWIAADRFGAPVPPPVDGGIAAARAPADGAPAPFDGAALEAAVDRAVARQIRPLLEAQAEADGRIRLRDIAGGLGWIIGLAGLALALRRRAP